MFAMILIDILILLTVGVPVVALHRKWRTWIDRESGRVWPFRGRRRFGLRSWAARSFVLDTPLERVRECIDGLPEMNYTEAATLIAARGRSASGSFMALAPLTGRQVFETGIETEWISAETVDLRTHAYADWPLNPLDEADLPAKQHQMTFEHALIHVEPQGEGRTRVSYELRSPAWVYLLYAAIVLLVGWTTWIIWRKLLPDTLTQRVNAGIMAMLVAGGLAYGISMLRLQSIALMDSVIRTFGSPARQDQ